METESGESVSQVIGEQDILHVKNVPSEVLSVLLRDKQSGKAWEMTVFPSYRSSRAGLVLYKIRGVPVGRELAVSPEYAEALDIEEEVAAEIAACEESIAEQCFSVAVRYQQGEPSTESARMAVAYLQRGCELDHSASCYEAGLAILRGEGAEQDYEAAEGAFERACELGLPDGCYTVAVLHRNRLLPRDEEKEQRFFQEACEGNIPLACSQVQ